MHNNENIIKNKGVFHKILDFAPPFFWMLLIFGFSDLCAGVMTLTAAAIHESGHILFLFIKYGKLQLPRGVYFGLKLSRERTLSYGEEAMLYASGPLANLFAAGIGLIFIPIFSEYILLFIAFNLATAIANLLPIKGHDGYGMIRSILLRLDISTRALDHISMITSLLLCLLALYTVDRVGEGYFIFALLLLSVFMTMKDGLSRIKIERL